MRAHTTPPARQELSEGALGVALLHIERGNDSATRDCLARTVANGVSTGANASLFHGAPALEFVLGRTGHTRPDVRQAVDHVVATRLTAAHRRQRTRALPHPAEFDLIRGLTGLGALLLSREDTSPLLHEVLACLIHLAQPSHIDGQQVPGWWSPRGPHKEPMNGGYGDNGLAHGIAGPLALLSLASRHGIQLPHQQDTIAQFAHWLDTYGDHYWTTPTHRLTPAPPPAPPMRPSWCYGQAGIARAHHLAALALNDTARRLAAENTLLRTLTDPTYLELITDASLCHGWAGLLTVVRSVSHDSPTPQRFTPLIDELTTRLAADVDQLPTPGFLEGRAGAQLALEGTDTTGWTRALLIT